MLAASKEHEYAALVIQRQECRWCAPGLTNPSVVADGAFDSDQIGPWTRWQGNLSADLMVVGKDWEDRAHFVRARGKG
jgi:hypothetical protein